MSARLRPTELEIASMVVHGLDPDPPPLEAVDTAVSPRRALEDVLLTALEHTPCGVAFSGGRDSSLLLAIAAHVARREGLPAPVPVSLRFPESERAQESEWQELVVGHLGLDDWVRPEVTDQMDFVGPVAQDVLRRHGVLWPANVHFVALPAAEVAGGALITGVGGDGVLAAGQHDLMGRSRGRGAARDVARGLYRSLPARARMPREMNRLRAISPWLRPAATAAVARQAIAAPTEPRRCDARLDHIYRHRVNVLTREGVEVLCAERNVRAVTPYLDRAFLVSFARFLGRGGVGGRTAATRILADGLLPERLITRPTKAAFPEAYCNRHTREFVRRWQGGGLDEELVDCARLRSLWEEDALLWPARSAALLQAAWLAEAGASAAVAAGSLGHPHSDRNREPT